MVAMVGDIVRGVPAIDRAVVSTDHDEIARVAEQARTLIQQQVEQSEEVGRVVEALETQYDAFTGARGRGLLADSSTMPTADEIGAEFERFLAGLDGDDEPSEQ